MSLLINKFIKAENGASFIEYSIIVAVIGAPLILGLSLLEGSMSEIFGDMATTVSNLEF